MSGLKVILNLFNLVIGLNKAVPDLLTKKNINHEVVLIDSNLHVCGEGSVHGCSCRDGVQAVVLGWCIIARSAAIVHTSHHFLNLQIQKFHHI
jgi:carbonic anhydrase/acetyltransferase-like protein (isoleucine patch superfamily)